MKSYNRKFMSTGKALRLRRLFKKDRTVIVPLDHGLISGVVEGAEDLVSLVDTIAQSEADGILITPGMLSKVVDVIGDLSVILRLDGAHTEQGLHLDRKSPVYEEALITTVEHAVSMGVDACVVNVFPGMENEQESFVKLSRVATACHEFGMPLIGEMLPASVLYHLYGTEDQFRPNYSDDVINACRSGAEHGADVIKTPYTISFETFKRAVDTSSVPLVILGGPKTDSTDEMLLSMVKDSIKAGGLGTCIGRNIWQHKNVLGMLAAICAIVHDDAQVSEAVKLL